MMSTRAPSIHPSFALLLLWVILAVPEPAAALYPGDCGKPGTSGLGNGDAPTAGDALIVLKAAVGAETCSRIICDVENNGKVSAADALKVLSKAVGQAVTLTCPTCATLPNVCAGAQQFSCSTNNDCTEPGSGNCVPSCITTQAQFLAKLKEDPNYTNMPATRVAALVDVTSPPVTWSVSNSSNADVDWKSLRVLEASGLWIHGEVYQPYAGASYRLPEVTIVPSDKCYSVENDPSPSNCGDTPNDGTDANAVFLKFGKKVGGTVTGGNNMGIVGFGVKGFYEGLSFVNANSTAGRMLFDRQCDTSVTNEATGVGSEVRDSTIRRGCDKCTEDWKGASTSGCSGRGCYHNAYYNVNFEGCEKSIRLSSQAENGRFFFQNILDRPEMACSNSATRICRVDGDCSAGGTCSNVAKTCSSNRAIYCSSNADCSGNACGTAWPCIGAELGANNVTSTTTAMRMDKCVGGMVFGAGTHTLNGESRIANSTHRGIVAQGNGSLTVRSTEIANNGGAVSASLDDAGVVVRDNNTVDLGNAATAGNNCIYGNKNAAGSGLEINNFVPNLKLQARSNWWNNGGAPPPSSEIRLHCSKDAQDECSNNTDCNYAPCTASKCSGNPMVSCANNIDCQAFCNDVVVLSPLTSGQAPAFCQ